MMGEIKYYLNIYHRSVAAAQDEAGAISKDMSPGHVYVSFQENDNQEEFFGFYKPDGVIPVGIGEIRTEKENEMHKNVGILSQRDNQDYIFGKQINLTQDQYIKAIDYARKKVSQDNYYIMGLEDCIDFTQSVYNAAGLPLYFTQIYSAEELLNLPILTSIILIIKYGVSTGLSESRNKTGRIVEGLSADEVASRLNIPVGRVKCVEYPIKRLFDSAADHMLLNFQVSLDESDMLSKNLVKTITPDAKTFRVEQLTGLMSSLELKGKLSRKREKINELNDEYCSEVNFIIKNMVKNKNKMLADVYNNFNAELSSEIQQININLEAYNHQVLNQKQSELTAETNERIAQAKSQQQQSAAAAFNNSGTITITITNRDIRDCKQSEYESMVAAYKQQCENKIERLKRNSKEKFTELSKTTENEITNKIDTLKNEVKKWIQELSSVLNEVATKIILGEKIDIEAVVNEQKVKLSGKLTGLKAFVDGSK